MLSNAQLSDILSQEICELITGTFSLVVKHAKSIVKELLLVSVADFGLPLRGKFKLGRNLCIL